MEIKEAIEYLRPIADSASLPNYAAALDTAIRSMEEVEALRKEDIWELRKELEKVKREREILLNEKCLDCPSHPLRHLGYCDHCRWKEG